MRQAGALLLPKAVVKTVDYLLHSMFRKLALFGAPATLYASFDVRSINHDGGLRFSSRVNVTGNKAANHTIARGPLSYKPFKSDISSAISSSDYC